eukprot:504125-Amphidinium_carterae.1
MIRGTSDTLLRNAGRTQASGSALHRLSVCGGSIATPFKGLTLLFPWIARWISTDTCCTSQSLLALQCAGGKHAVANQRHCTQGVDVQVRQATLHLYEAFWGLLLPVTVHGRVSDIWCHL